MPSSLPLPSPRRNPSINLWTLRARLVLGAWLVIAVAVCFARTLAWPLVNDGALQHYISFLTDAGLAPYRQIYDMNLPGSLMIDWTVIHTLGDGPLAWRLFDALLMLAAGAAMLTVTRPYDWFAGLFAAALFWLLHARDGIGQTSQRDLMEAVLLLAAVAFAFHAVRSHRQWPLAAFGLCGGIAIIIKPDSLALLAIVLGALATQLLPKHRPRAFAIAAAASLVPSAAAFAFLLHHGAVHAFWTSLTEITPFYASLDRQSLRELLRDCLSPPMRVLLAATIVLAVVNRRRAPNRWTWERSTVAAAVLWGLASFFLQGKGYLYHRYPTLGFLLLWAGIEATEALRSTPWPAVAGAAALLYGSLVIAPLSLARASRATWNSELLNALQTDLTQLGGTAILSGNIQCIDSISGCNTVLYRMHVPEATGMLSDFLIFGPATQPAVRRTRAAFWHGVSARPPRVIVVTGWLHPAGPDDFRKLDLWPAFATLLRTRYTLTRQRRFSPGMSGPLAYRIYVLR